MILLIYMISSKQFDNSSTLDSYLSMVSLLQGTVMDAPEQQQQPQQQPQQQQPQQQVAPQGPQQPLAVPQNVQQPILNWSHFRPVFAGRPEEDAEAHLLHTNDWMKIHNIPVDLKVGRYCLTLVGEARLWYESLQPIVNDWPALQDQFRHM